jgi:hypothetical protein
MAVSFFEFDGIQVKRAIAGKSKNLTAPEYRPSLAATREYRCGLMPGALRSSASGLSE